ncbi:PucR family transcriptional regulator [Gordonia sp. NPDC003504]
MDKGGIGLGQLVLALDRTLVSLDAAPRGLDVPIDSVSLLDPDDLHLPLRASTRSADLFLLVGATPEAVIAWLSTYDSARPAAVMIKSPTPELTAHLTDLGVAVVSVDPHARWERAYNLVTHVVGAATTPSADAESMRSGTVGDLFDLAAEVARRTHGLVSIEDDHSHVLAYSSTGDEADELRRLSILGREGPPDMLAWLRQWGVMDALRTTTEVVSVDERADLALRPRLAVGIRAPHEDPIHGEHLGTMWIQQGREPLSDDAAEVLTGAAAVAARIIVRRRNAGTGHDELVRRLLGARGDVVDVPYLCAQLGISPSSSVVVVAFDGLSGAEADAGAPLSAAGVVSALTLHASAFSPLSVTTTLAGRAYVVLPGTTLDATVDWATSAVTAAHRQFGVDARAVIAGPGTEVASVSSLRAQADRVLDAAHREAGLIHPVTTVSESKTGVLLGEIIALIESNPELIDSRVIDLAERDRRSGGDLTISLRAYLDHFGDVRAAADALHVHPNTLRYRMRRIQELTGMDLDDPATRLVVALTLRASMASR